MTIEEQSSGEEEVKTDTQPIPKMDMESTSSESNEVEEVKTDTQPLPVMSADDIVDNPEAQPDEDDQTPEEAKEEIVIKEHAPRHYKDPTDDAEKHRKPMSDFEHKMLIMKIRDMDDLPTPNEHVSKIVRLLQSPEVKIHEVVEIIEHDESLVAQILKLINSGFFSMRDTITNVEQAVNLLGILQVKKLVYSASIMELFSREMKEDFEHAYSASALMSKLMEMYQIPAASNLPLTMLVHDIGKIVLNRFAPKKCQLARAYANQKQIPYYWGERHVLGMDHAEIAHVMLKKWEMTDDIIKPITQHHTKGIPDSFIVETALVHFVDYIDGMARNRIMSPINRHLMSAAEIELTEEDIDGWIEHQRNFIIDCKNP